MTKPLVACRYDDGRVRTIDFSEAELRIAQYHLDPTAQAKRLALGEPVTLGNVTLTAQTVDAFISARGGAS